MASKIRTASSIEATKFAFSNSGKALCLPAGHDALLWASRLCHLGRGHTARLCIRYVASFIRSM